MSVNPNTEITIEWLYTRGAVTAQAFCREWEERGYEVLSVSFTKRGVFVTLRGPKAVYIDYRLDGDKLYQVGPYASHEAHQQLVLLMGSVPGVIDDYYITARRDHTRIFIGTPDAE